jgi:hypothetical protein
VPQKMPDKRTQFRLNQLTTLLGGRIVGVAWDPSDPSIDPITGLRILMSNNKEVIMWILRDDEGNGPGSFDIQK